MDIRPATVDRWPDVELLLGGNGKGGCWCQPWRGVDAIAKARGESRPDTLRRQMTTAVPPGFLAYEGAEPVGWVGTSVRTETPGLLRSRKIPSIDDQPYWAVGCFRIRVGFRRKGVAKALLQGVIDAAKAAGAPGVEAYPIDPEGRRVDVTFAYVGLIGMFDAAGFRRVVVTDATSAGLRRHLVRLDLG